RANYLDFLNREADAGGLDYWSQQILTCQVGDLACIRSKRSGVSATFFVELEFQQTGSFVYRSDRSSLERRPAFAEFMADRSVIVAGASLEISKQAFANYWVQRPEVLQKYPDSLS